MSLSFGAWPFSKKPYKHAQHSFTKAANLHTDEAVKAAAAGNLAKAVEHHKAAAALHEQAQEVHRKQKEHEQEMRMKHQAHEAELKSMKAARKSHADAAAHQSLINKDHWAVKGAKHVVDTLMNNKK